MEECGESWGGGEVRVFLLFFKNGLKIPLGLILTFLGTD